MACDVIVDRSGEKTRPPVEILLVEGAISICEYCGDQQEIELLEVWDSRAFMISACCEALEEDVRWGLSHDPDWARQLLRHLGIEEITGEKLRRVADDDTGGLMLDWQFRFERIEFRDARRFIEHHHEHCRSPTGWKFGQGLFNGPELIAVVIVGQPLARAFDRHQVVEVTRLCARRDRPAALRWNACSALYGWAAREAKLRGFRRIITYTRLDENGASLRAAGWDCEGAAGGRSWNWRGRPRVDRAPPCPRLRWSRHLAQPPQAPRTRKPSGPEPMWMGEWKAA